VKGRYSQRQGLGGREGGGTFTRKGGWEDVRVGETFTTKGD